MSLKKKKILRCDGSLQLHTASAYVELSIFGHQEHKH